MGIWEKMPDPWLDRLGAEFAFEPPRRHGYDTVEAIRAMRDGRVRRGYIGIAGQRVPIPRTAAREQRLLAGAGVRVVTLVPKSPASIAGLKVGDVIIALGDHVTSGVDDLHRVLTEERIGVDLPVVILRDGRRVSVAVRPVESQRH